MIEHFEIGESAIIWIPGHWLHKEEVTVVSPLRYADYTFLRNVNSRGPVYSIRLRYMTDLESITLDDPFRGLPCPAGSLRRKEPPKTNREMDTKIPWDDCVWKPAKTKVISVTRSNTQFFGKYYGY